MQSEVSQGIYELLTKAKRENKKGKEALIESYLRGKGKLYQNRWEVMHFLYSPFWVFNVKPKKTWQRGTDNPTATWDHARQLLLDLEARNITGNAAKEEAQKMGESLSVPDAEVFLRCLEKRPDAGMGVSTINKVIEGYLPEFKCAMAEPVDFSRCKWPMIIQPKLDGVRTLAHIDFSTETVTYFSRKGLKFTSMSHLDDCLKSVAIELADIIGEEKGVVLDGEVFGNDFKQTISSARKKDGESADTDFHLYDYIPADEFFTASFSESQENRTLHLKWAHVRSEAERVLIVPSDLVENEEEAKEKFAEHQANGLEGAILKDPAADYSFRRNFCWMKMKSEDSEDLFVVGYEEGTGKYAGQLGALIVDFNGVHVRVGSGLTDKLREELWPIRDELVGRIVEVEYMEVTPDGSLRHPRFVAFRDLPENPGIKI